MTKSVDPEKNYLLSFLLKCFKNWSHIVIYIFETIKIKKMGAAEFFKKFRFYKIFIPESTDFVIQWFKLGNIAKIRKLYSFPHLLILPLNGSD